jgi:hypothetical protein
MCPDSLSSWLEGMPDCHFRVFRIILAFSRAITHMLKDITDKPCALAYNASRMRSNAVGCGS